VDFANPDAREWFKGIIRNALELGVDGVKLDRGQNYPLNVTPPSGRDPRAMHNYHAYLMVKTYAEVLEEERGRDYQLTPRAGWAGTQSWTMKWPGDMDSDLSHDRGLPAVIRAQSAAGLTGFAFWGSDIGGYGPELSKEVFVRWLQHGVFSPLMQMPGKGNHEDVPFSWDEETVRIYEWYARLRKKMLPYILKQAEKAHHTGTPMVRHLAWSWEDDPEVHSRDYQYMFGDDLLVACVVDLSETREVYLPEGEWVDFWNRDRVLTGPKTIMERVPLSRIPLYIRKEAAFEFELPDLPLP
jgi:alpha-D-xyloside xylohydrolase